MLIALKITKKKLSNLLGDENPKFRKQLKLIKNMVKKGRMYRKTNKFDENFIHYPFLIQELKISLGDNADLTKARLGLILAVAQTIAVGLGILGVKPVKEMR